MGIRSVIRNWAGVNNAENRAYALYEQATGTTIISRDPQGDPIFSSNGLYALLPGVSAHNNTLDTFKHATTSGILARDYGVAISHLIGDLGELVGRNPVDEKYMDWHSNGWGRENAGALELSDIEIAHKVLEGISMGELMLSPSNPDDLIYTGGSFIENYAEEPIADLWSRAQDAVLTTLVDRSLNGIIADLKDTLFISQNHVSPLSFDLDGDGIETTHIYDDTEVYFDIDNDGFKERVGWIASDDGMLAIDTNGDGVINDITELFGDDIMPAYQKLAQYDTNGDGVISSLDDQFDDLLAWRDLNQDGYSQANELQGLITTGIKEISLAEAVRHEYQNENYISGSSSFTWTNGTQGTMYDVHFLNDNTNTWFDSARAEQFGSDYTIDPLALILPLSRGYGSLASLHIAMTDDVDFLNMMRDLVLIDANNFDQLSEQMTAFLYQWAGVQDNDPEARQTGNGSNIDARMVDFIEQFTGVEWAQMGSASLVGSKASLGVKKIWSEIEALMTARVLVQGTLHDEIFENATYDFVTDTMTLGDDMATLVTRASDYAANISSSDTLIDFWRSIGNVLVTHKDELAVTIAQISDALDATYGGELFIGEIELTSADGDVYTAINGGAEQIHVNAFVGTENDDVITGTNANDMIVAGAGADIVYGRGGDDFIRGDGGGDLLLDGGDGDDRIEGADGADILVGGEGRDDLRGGAGVDSLQGGGGNDKLHGGGGADVLDGGLGEDEIDYLESDQAVYINLKTNQALGGHAEGDTYVNIENITGSDFSDVLIGDGQANLINGERGDDIIYGHDGNDLLFGADGQDILYGEEGNDELRGFDGAELMDGGNGIDTVSYAHPFVTTGVHVNLLEGMGSVGAALGDVYVSIENVYGSGHDDVLIGDDGANLLHGGDGVDLLNGQAGDDVLHAGLGSAHLMGGAGYDRFIITPDVVAIRTIYDFDLSEDSLDYSLFTSDVTQNVSIDVSAIGSDALLTIDNAHKVFLRNVDVNDILQSGISMVFGNTTLQNISVGVPTQTALQFEGDQFGNRLFGSLISDQIGGHEGNDELYGFAGADTLIGGAGNDILTGGLDADVIDGGEGSDDVVSFLDSFEGVQVDLSLGTAVGGTAEGDVISNIENIRGSVFDDRLTGTIVGGVLKGFAGDDTLVVTGGKTNRLFGGTGKDTFVINQYEEASSSFPDLPLVVKNTEGVLVIDYKAINSSVVIEDFDILANEKIDVSSFDLASIHVTSLVDWQINGELVTGTALYLSEGDIYQLVILRDTEFSQFTADHLILPQGFSAQDVIWQVLGNHNDNILIASPNDDLITVGQGSDIVSSGAGDDDIYGSVSESDLFIVSKDAGSTDTIYNFDSYYHTYNWYPGEIGGGISYSVGIHGDNVVDELTSGLIDVFDLTAFANIRNFLDLNITSIDTDNNGVDDRSFIDLGEGQKIIIEGFSLGIGNVQNQVGTFNSPEYGIVGFGVLFQADSWTLHDNNFIFYSGELVGTNHGDTLAGGYGADEIWGHDGADTLTGAGDDDILHGGEGADVLIGGAGNDILDGGSGADVYVIEKNANAVDTIQNFEYWRPEEQIDLSAFDVDFASYSDFLSTMSQDGSNTRIDLGNGQFLVVENFSLSDLSAQNFIGNAGYNQNPNAVDDQFVVSTQTVAGNVLLDNGHGADVDPDSGDQIQVVAGTYLSKKGGTVVVNASGEFTYTAADILNYSQDSFDYTISDGKGGLDTAIVSIVFEDVVFGTDGNDTFSANLLADIIHAGAGDDVIYLNGSGDKVTGGAGSENYVIQHIVSEENSEDIIRDFDASNDKLDLSAYSFIQSLDDLHIQATTIVDVDVTYDALRIELPENANQSIILRGLSDPSELTLANFTFDQPPLQGAVDQYSVNTNETLVIWRSDLLANDIELNDRMFLAFQGVVQAPLHGQLIDNGDGSLSYIAGDTIGEDRFVYSLLDVGEGDNVFIDVIINIGYDNESNGRDENAQPGDIIPDDEQDSVGDVGNNDQDDPNAPIDSGDSGEHNDQPLDNGRDENAQPGDIIPDDEQDSVDDVGESDQDDPGAPADGSGDNDQDVVIGDDLDDGRDSTSDEGSDYNDGRNEGSQPGNPILAIIAAAQQDIVGSDSDAASEAADNPSRYGTAENDIILGDNLSNVMFGYEGDDILYGADNMDILFGGDGADTFVIAADSVGIPDVIMDFSSTEQDVIDLSAILSDGRHDPLQAALDDFVILTSSGSGTTIELDVDGSGLNYTFQAVVTVENQTWESLQNAIDSGDIKL